MKTGWFGTLFETAILTLSVNIIIRKLGFEEIDRFFLVIGLAVLYGNWISRIENIKENP